MAVYDSIEFLGVHEQKSIGPESLGFRAEFVGWTTGLELVVTSVFSSRRWSKNAVIAVIEAWEDE